MEPTLEQITQTVEQLFKEKKYQEIITLLGNSLLAHYNSTTLYIWRSRANNKFGDIEASFADAQKSIELDPLLADGYRARGNNWLDKSDYDKAIEDYNNAIQLNPTDAASYYNLGLTWAKVKDYDKAITNYTNAIRLDPNDSDGYFGRATARSKIKDYDKAIIDYTNAIQLSPNDAVAYYHRGLAWSDKKDYEKAIIDYKYSIDLADDINDYYSQVASNEIKELKKKIENAWYDDFDSIINKIKRLLLFDSPCLTHYTSLSGARAMILNNSPFRLSEGAFLNDTSEGRELFNYLSFETTEPTTDDTMAELFVERPFIGSFVADNKHNDLILWRMYGKEAQAEAKGCALTIYKTNFIDSIKKTLSPIDTKAVIQSQDEEQFTFYKVAYLSRNIFIIPGKNDEDESQLNTLIGELKEKVAKMDNKQKISVTKLLNEIAYLFKSSEYQYENEVRLVVQGVGFTKKIEVEGNPPKVYIELVDIVPALKKITLGPKVERADEWAAAFNYHIKDQLIDKEEKVEIVISTLPFK